MIRIICFFLLGVTLGRADAASDKFDLVINAIALKGNTIEMTLKITNQSVTSVKIDLTADAVVLKAAAEKPSLQAQDVATRVGIYKPRVVILVPGDRMVFLPSKSARLFAPKTLAPGESLDLVKAVGIDPISFLKDVETHPYSVFMNLAYRVDGDPKCQAAGSTPTYKIVADANGALSLTQ